MNIPTKEENRFLNYLEEYIVKLEKEKPNSIWKIDLPWFSVFWIHESIIISKSYGFIQWLVENDKIDEVKLRWKMYQVFEFRYQDVATLENELLMLLSIQDNPIEFLISILK